MYEYQPRFLFKKKFLLIILLVLTGELVFLSWKTNSYAQSQPSFTFTAAGDYGASSDATAVLNGTNPAVSGANLNLALGDLSYANLTPESAWCDYVKQKVGTSFPFEIVAGNHEDDSPSGNNIDNFATCLPDQIGGITGRYSREYFFDYPVASPLTRFIMISPDLTFLDEGTYNYSSGNAHYNWVANAIDSARSAGIAWIVVGMHKNCISMGNYSCNIGTGLFNLLIDKKVDLILQGHDHTYQRSHQLTLGPSCSGIVSGSSNANCVVDNGSDNNYTKGAGSVLAIVGTGGKGLYNINLSDSEAGYFSKWMGNNINPSQGFLKVAVSNTQMNFSFEPQVGTFTDSFSIDSGLPSATPVPPTETPALTPTPTTDPFAPTPTATLPPTPTPTPVTSQTVSSQVSSPSADAEERISSGSIDLTSSDLELGADGSNPQIVGMRFASLNIPNGATVINAYLEFEVDETGSSATSVTISGEKADNPAVFTTANKNISNRLKTVSQIPWNNIPAWNTVNAKQQSPDISSIISEVVSRPGWTQGNSLVITISGSGRRTAESFNGEAANAPKLTVTYSN